MVGGESVDGRLAAAAALRELASSLQMPDTAALWWTGKQQPAAGPAAELVLVLVLTCSSRNPKAKNSAAVGPAPRSFEACASVVKANRVQHTRQQHTA